MSRSIAEVRSLCEHKFASYPAHGIFSNENYRQAFIDFKVKHPRLEEMDQDLMRRIDSRRRYTILAVFASSTTTKRLQAAQRQAQKAEAYVIAVGPARGDHRERQSDFRSGMEHETLLKETENKDRQWSRKT